MLEERTRYSVRDVLYGSVPLTAAAYATLDTRAFQRLKHIKQVGPAYLVYPGATHTRFSHSIGVYHLARLALQHLSRLVKFDDEVGRATMAAALLHDLGHFPYSHVIDEISMDGTHLSHADLSVEIIEQDAELGRVLAHTWEVAPRLVADLIAGRPNPRIPRCLYKLIDGPMDIDKLDYLNRDAHHTGVPYGKVEVQRLIEFLEVEPETGDLLVTEAGTGTVESVIFAKYLMFRYIYWHHTARIAATMINRAVLDGALALGLKELSIDEPRLRRICLATDSSLEWTLRGLFDEAGVSLPESFSTLGRVEERRLYKRALAVPCGSGRDLLYRDSLVKRERERELSERLGGDVLIDVPPVAKFAAWEVGESYFTGATVAAMEQSIRFVLYLYDPESEVAREELARIAESEG